MIPARDHAASTRTAAVMVLLGALLLAGIGAPGWISVSGADPVTGNQLAHTFSGHQIAPVLLAAALALGAALLVLALAGRSTLAGRLVGIVTAVAGAGTAWQGWSAMSTPHEAVRLLTTELVTVTSWDYSAVATLWPVLALGLGALIAATGAYLIVRPLTGPSRTRHTRPEPGTRQRSHTADATTTSAAPADDELDLLRDVDTWDQLSRGEDPTLR